MKPIRAGFFGFVGVFLSSYCSIRLFVLWFGLDKCQVPSKTALSLPLFNRTGERKYDERLEGGDKDRERSLTN